MSRTCQPTSRIRPIPPRETVPPNWLGEALRIASGQSHQVPERAHLVAVIEHCRKLVGALMSLPEAN